MTELVRFLDAALIEATVRRARESARRRVNHNFHSGPEDNPHRFLNVFLRGSYVAPHRHLAPPKSETFLVLEGSMALFCFNDAGAVTGRWLLGPATDNAREGFEYAGIGLDLSPGVWHTVAALSETAVCFEVKPGPWDPGSDKEFAPWAPREGEAGAAEYLEGLLQGCGRGAAAPAPGRRASTLEPSAAARALQALRTTRAGGRPRSEAPRCPCGAMTLSRAQARRHKCGPASWL